MHPIWICDDAGNILRANTDACRLAGHAPELLGQSPDSMAVIHQQMMDAASNILVYAFDLEGRCLIANKQVANALHTTPNAMLGKMREQFMPEETALAHFANDQIVARFGQPVTFEETTEDECGVQIYSSMKFPLRDAAGNLVAVGGLSSNITAQRAAETAQRHSERQIEIMAQKCVEMQEIERANLSRELHDEIGQMMTVLKLSLTQVSHKVFTDPAGAVEAANYSMKIADEVIGSMRNIARRLRPPQLDDLGLMASLRWHVDRLATQSVPTILFHENIGNARFEPNLELACFRVVQEAISNALRHARASFICVVLIRLHGQLELSVIDDGDGFCETDVEKSDLHSLGLLGMRERVIGIGGSFRINSQLHLGTEILAKFTLPPAP